MAIKSKTSTDYWVNAKKQENKERLRVFWNRLIFLAVVFVFFALAILIVSSI